MKALSRASMGVSKIKTISHTLLLLLVWSSQVFIFNIGGINNVDVARWRRSEDNTTRSARRRRGYSRRQKNLRRKPVAGSKVGVTEQIIKTGKKGFSYLNFGFYRYCCLTKYLDVQLSSKPHLQSGFRLNLFS